MRHENANEWENDPRRDAPNLFASAVPPADCCADPRGFDLNANVPLRKTGGNRWENDELSVSPALPVMARLRGAQRAGQRPRRNVIRVTFT